MKSPKNLTARIDAFINFRVPQETPAYKTMMHDRLLDLCNRQVAISDAGAYLKSAGWSLDFALYYKELIKFCEDADNQEKDTIMDESKVDLTFSTSQVQELLKALAEEFAASAGFRPLNIGESLADYRKEVNGWLKQSNDVSIDSEVADLMREQLATARETLSAQIAYYDSLKK